MCAYACCSHLLTHPTNPSPDFQVHLRQLLHPQLCVQQGAPPPALTPLLVVCSPANFSTKSPPDFQVHLRQLLHPQWCVQQGVPPPAPTPILMVYHKQPLHLTRTLRNAQAVCQSSLPSRPTPNPQAVCRSQILVQITQAACLVRPSSNILLGCVSKQTGGAL